MDIKNRESEEPSVYSNPTKKTKTDIAGAYFSDPYCFRFDGSYYLYTSGKINKPLICHKSDDLIHWEVGVPAVSEDELPAGKTEHGFDAKICMSGYAPEVVYYNGIFVLVTSPGGMGHYVYTSESPMGPFKRASENFGCKIDGDIFIDNDGKWYFYYASSQNIQCREMTGPTEINTECEPIKTGAIIDEGAGTWTEGSMIVYHDGIYYMTYTGNHTARATYRVEYGISYDDPTHFRRDPDSQVFISTSDAASGIGHSSSVKGPDLDSYYMVYHTRAYDCVGKDFNLDRIIFNGERMTVMGPTVGDTPVPGMPDVYSHFDEEKDKEKFEGISYISDGCAHLDADAIAVARDTLARDTYTIEITTKNIEKDARAGVIFGYKDDNNFGSALFDTKTEELVITFTVDGNKTEHREKLVRSFDIPYRFDVIQAIQVEKTGNIFTFYVGDRILAKHESTLSGLGVGMMTEGGAASFGYFGATAATSGNSTKEFYKPVASQTGYILAAHSREWDIKTGIKADTKEVVLKAETGREYNYLVYAERDADYSLSVCYRAEMGAVISVSVDGSFVKAVKLYPSDDFASEIARSIPLTKGAHTLTVTVNSGEADILYYRCMIREDAKALKASDEPSYSDGTRWQTEGEATSTFGPCKRLWGSRAMDNYTASVKIKADENARAGLLLRATDPGEATFIKGKDCMHNFVITTDEGAKKGANWVMGYYAEIADGAVTLYKLSYNKILKDREVFSAPCILYSGENTLSVRCDGARLTLLVNGETVGEYKDAEPYMCGMAGLRCNSDSEVVFDGFEIDPIN